jgi:hypothetical protein
VSKEEREAQRLNEALRIARAAQKRANMAIALALSGWLAAAIAYSAACNQAEKKAEHVKWDARGYTDDLREDLRRGFRGY